MTGRRNRLVDNANMQVSNVFSSWGQLDCIGGYICANGMLSNFMISGGAGEDDRYQPLYPVLDFVIGQMPVVILHANDIYMETIVSEIWQSKSDVQENALSPLWLCNNNISCFEPFYGMADMQIVTVLRQLAVKLNYTVTPRFERVVKAHLSILKELDIPYSLSGLYYLCQFYDIGEFHENIMALPCGETMARRIWADLGVDEESSNDQFDLFRAVINNLAHDAEQSGWNPENTVCECNCMQAVKSHAVMLLSVNALYSDMLLAYLAEEFKVCIHMPFLLLIDGLKINDESMLEYLCTQNTSCYLGVISENAVDQIGSDEETFLRLAERMNYLVLFKHSTSKTATTLSEVFGKCDYTKVESSQGVSGGIFNFMPRDRHDDVRYSIENRYRIMPEEIIDLRSGQAIIFDTNTNQIIRFN